MVDREVYFVMMAMMLFVGFINGWFWKGYFDDRRRS